MDDMLIQTRHSDIVVKSNLGFRSLVLVWQASWMNAAGICSSYRLSP